MGIRETINKRPITAGVVCGVILVAALGAVISGNSLPASAKRAYFSDDDGKTFFIDDISKIVPFDHGGKPACRAMVYQFGNSPPFVGYLLRYNDDGRAKMTKAMADQAIQGELPALRTSSSEVKKPGDAKWVPLFSNKGEAISMYPIGPDGNRAACLSP